MGEVHLDEVILNWFTDSYTRLNIGKLDMGKSCIRFKNMDKIPYDLISELCSKMSVDEYVRLYERNRIGKR